VLADLEAPTGFRQTFAFAVVVTMRLASLRWGLHTPLPDDLVHKLTPERHQGEDAPQDTAGTRLRARVHVICNVPDEGRAAA